MAEINPNKYLSYSGLARYTERILKIIEDNEYVVAAAITKISDDVREKNTIKNTENLAQCYLLGSRFQNGEAAIHTQNGVYMSNNNLYATSDERLKNFIDDVPVDLEALKTIPKQYFTWKADDKNVLNIGTSAQAVKEVYPELVTYNEEKDEYGVDYQKLSIVALAAVDKLHEENQLLKERLDNIEAYLKTLM
jgi:hypothetical protein